MENESIREVSFKEAVEISEKGKRQIIWLGREPASYISDILGLESGSISKKNPEEIVYMEKSELKDLEKSVLLCYHGNTSGFISKFLMKQHAIETYSLKGGITAIVGEIF